MPLTSQLAAAEDALLAALQAQAAEGGSPLAGVALQLGNPGSGRKVEHVWISEDATGEQSWDTTGSGAQSKTEVITLTVFVFVQKGSTYSEFRDRLQALVGEVEQAILADFRLGGAVDDSEVVRVDRAGGRTETGYMVAAEVQVRCTRWLS